MRLRIPKKAINLSLLVVGEVVGSVVPDIIRKTPRQVLVIWVGIFEIMCLLSAELRRKDHLLSSAMGGGLLYP